jgi:hypothetical protein
MQELSYTEVLSVSGGNSNNGYNVEFIVKNTVLGALIGVIPAAMTNNSQFITGCAVLFGGYATVMMAATAIDNQVF